MVRFLAAFLAVWLGLSAAVRAAEVMVPVTRLEDGAALGAVRITEAPGFGLVFAPDLKGLPPGFHGFHLHEKGDCGAKEKDGKMVPGLAAGGHYDPQQTGRHEGPYGHGHLGDLPVLWVEQDGTGSRPVLAQRPALADLHGRALVIHAGGDNYADTPEPLGGGGSRIACGVVP